MTGPLPVSPEVLLALGVFFGALLVLDGLRRILGRARSTEALAERRVRAAARADRGAPALPAALVAQPPRPGRAERMTMLLDAAGITMKPTALAAIVIGAGLAAFSAAALVLPPVLAVAASAVLTLLAAYAVIDRMRANRIAKITAQLPDALDLMARALKVGHPLNTSMQAVSREMPAPIAAEFARMVDQVTYGEEVVSAFHDLARRNASEDLNYLAVAVGIQHGTGGDLARILQILARTIRDRATMRRKIHAISAEGRISALILSVLPFAIVAMTHFAAPTYYGEVAHHPNFLPLALVAVTLTLANLLILRRLVSFKF